MTRILSFIGIIGLTVALIGAALLGTRAFPRADLTTRIGSEALQARTAEVEAVTAQPDAAAGPTTFRDTLADDSLILTGLALAAAFGIALLASIVKTAFVTRAGRIGCFLSAGIGALVLVLGAVGGMLWLMSNLAPMGAAPASGDMAAEEPAEEEPAAEEEVAAEEPAEEVEYETTAPTQAAITATAAPAPTEPAASPTQPVEESFQTVIEVEWPVQMEIDRSDTVRIALVRVSDGLYVPTAEVAGNVVEAATPIPVGTPGSPIEEAFGGDYQAFATASLVGTTFNIERGSLARRSLAGDRIVWDWNLTPTAKGPQILSANIVIEWEPVNGGAVIERQIWQARLDTEVKKRIVPTRNAGLITAFSSVIGSVFSIPWIFDRMQDFVFGRIQDWLYDRAKTGVQRRAARRRKKRQSKTNR